MGESGLSLVCTPGNDVDAVTGLVAAGCNVVIFSTGLGTPTGNPIVPVLKVSTNSALAKKMPDIIDYDCGPIIEGTPLADIADGLFEKIIATASGTWRTKADALEQYDFMLWKRSLELYSQNARQMPGVLSSLPAQIGAAYRFIRQQRVAGILQHHVTVFQHVAAVGQLQRLVGVLLDEEDGHPCSRSCSMVSKIC
jgi:hypothetical protein